MAKTLFIVGAGHEQVPAYERAKKRGLFIVGSDVNENAPGLRFADHSLIVSTRDADGTLSKALAFHQEHRIDGVMTIANDVPYTVAKVANRLELPSIQLDAAQCAMDKLAMKERFQNNHVDCPWFSEVTSVQGLRKLVGDFQQGSYVIKPVDGCGARGVLLLEPEVDLNWAFEESRRWGKSGRLILEKFIPGVQLSTESFILEGRCYTPAIAERNYARLDQFRPNIIEDGGTIPAKLSQTQLETIDDLIMRGAAAMGVDTGIVKGDLVIDCHGHPLVIELALRLSGGWLATHQIVAATGVDLVDAVISNALGEPVLPEQLIPNQHDSTAIRYWFPPEGRIVNIRGEDELKRTPGLIKYGFFRKQGDCQSRIRMHPDRFGYVIVGGEDRQEATQRVNRALSCLSIQVV
ncbi:MAG: ATP-grasp domain-containing protein [Verrucomicrobiota bacterium]|nr:ATP-grasp domain-containing protein [Verrucomicrobiota bacterium]